MASTMQDNKNDVGMIDIENPNDVTQLPSPFSSDDESSKESEDYTNDSIRRNLFAEEPFTIAIKGENDGKSSSTVTSRASPSLKVFVRIRPVKEGTASTVKIQDSNSLRTFPPSESASFKSHRPSSKQSLVKEYKVDKIFDENTNQIKLFDEVGIPILDYVFSGEDGREGGQNIGLFFAYGMTNAGKTHTVIGGVGENTGLLPRTLNAMIKRCEADTQIHMSYLEIYQDKIFDLLPNSEQGSQQPNAGKRRNNSSERNPLRLRDDRGKVSVQHLTSVKLTSADQAKYLLQRAQQERHTCSNGINDASSRSHIICQLKVTKVGDKIAPGQDSGELWFVDLAGSERMKRTRNAQESYARRKEGIWINGSLMQLMRCLRSNGTEFVSYRESKLTHLLWPHLSSERARSVMMVNIHPSTEDYDETQRVLQYAAKAKSIVIVPHPKGQKRKSLSYHGIEYDINGRQKRGRTNAVSVAAHNQQKRPPRFAKKAVGAATRVGVQSHALKGTAQPEGEKIRSLEKQIQIMQTQLQLSQAELSVIKQQHVEELSDLEHRIRGEVAEEMALQLGEAQEELEAQLEKLKLKHTAELAQASSAMEKSVANKVLKRDEMIRELKQQVNECEEEMIRMRSDYEAELARKEKALRLTAAPGDLIERSGVEECGATLNQVRSENDCAFARNESALQQDKTKNDLIGGGDHDVSVPRYEQKELQGKEATPKLDTPPTSPLGRDRGTVRDVSEPLMSEEQDDNPKPNDSTSPWDLEDEMSSSEVLIGKKLPSEAEENKNEKNSCTQTVVPMQMEASNCAEEEAGGKENQNKKDMVTRTAEREDLRMTGERTTSRAPFGNVLHQSNHQSDVGHDLLMPKKPPGKKKNGEFKKPRGRAPSGREWDSKHGGWRLSQIQ